MANRSIINDIVIKYLELFFKNNKITDLKLILKGLSYNK